MIARIERRARAVAADRADRLTVALRAVVPGASVVRAGGDIVVTGRGVLRALRWPGGLLR